MPPILSAIARSTKTRANFSWSEMNTCRLRSYSTKASSINSDLGQKRLALVTALECNYNYGKTNARAFNVVFIKSSQQQVKRLTSICHACGGFWPALGKQIENTPSTRSHAKNGHCQKYDFSEANWDKQNRKRVVDRGRNFVRLRSVLSQSLRWTF